MTAEQLLAKLDERCIPARIGTGEDIQPETLLSYIVLCVEQHMPGAGNDPGVAAVKGMVGDFEAFRQSSDASAQELQRIGDQLQSAASRVAAYVGQQDDVPYETLTAAIEIRGLVCDWTDLRRRWSA